MLYVTFFYNNTLINFLTTMLYAISVGSYSWILYIQKSLTNHKRYPTAQRQTNPYSSFTRGQE